MSLTPKQKLAAGGIAALLVWLWYSRRASAAGASSLGSALGDAVAWLPQQLGQLVNAGAPTPSGDNTGTITPTCPEGWTPTDHGTCKGGGSISVEDEDGHTLYTSTPSGGTTYQPPAPGTDGTVTSPEQIYTSSDYGPVTTPY